MTRVIRPAAVTTVTNPEPTLASTGPRVSLTSAGATLTPSWGGSEVVINVGDDWPTKIAANSAGTTFRVKTGIHRRTCLDAVPKNGMSFIGESGAILNACIDIGNTGWTNTSGVYSKTNAAWPATSDGGVGPGQFDATYEAQRYREDLFIDDVPLQRLGSGGTGGAGSFTTTPGAGQWSYDSSTKTIYIGQNPATHTVEVSFTLGGSNRCLQDGGGGTAGERVTLKNLIIKGYATSNQDAAVACLDAGGGGTSSTSFPMNTTTNGYDYTGATPEGGSSGSLGGWLIDHCEMLNCHSVALFAGPGTIVQDCYIHQNGQVGAKGAGRNIVYRRSRINDNNYTHYDVFVEAGGYKAFNSTNSLFQDCELNNNRGFAWWNDYTFDGHIIEYCLFQDNYSSGISCEMTEGAEIRYNQFIANCKHHYAVANGIGVTADPDWAANYFTGQVWGYNCHNQNIHHNYIDTGTDGWGGVAWQEQERGGVYPLSQGTGATSTSGPYAGHRATCAGSSATYNSIRVRTLQQGNCAAWRGIVTQDYTPYSNITPQKAGGWVFGVGSNEGGTNSDAYTLTIDHNWYHLPASGGSATNSDGVLESTASTNYAWFPFRWDGPYSYQVFSGTTPNWTGTNLYYVLDSGRRFGSFTQWRVAVSNSGTGGFGKDANSSVTYDL